MTSPDFAAAQQRVLARRQQREAEARNRLESLRTHQAANRLSQLPGPLGEFGRKGVETWDTIKGRSGTRPAYRVGQVDAELLDEELLSLLKAQVSEALKFFGPHLSQDWSAEILLALRAVLFKLSIWDNDTSYGAALQGLKYTDARHSGTVLKAPSTWQKGFYGLATVAGRYAWTKWDDWLIDKEGGYEEPSMRVRLLSRLSSFISTTHDTAALVSFVVFLLNGRYRTLLDRVLRLRLVPPTNQVSREVSFEYLNRQLVWHAFTEFLLFLLPLVGISRWRRWLARAWRKAKALAKSGGVSEEEEDKAGGELGFLPERTCAICYQQQNPTSTTEAEVLAVGPDGGGVIGSVQTDVTNPYETIPCGCIYCFVCIATKLDAEEGEGFICLKCGEMVKECKPWSGDVVEPNSRSNSGKSVTFADEGDEDSEEEQEMRHIEPNEDPENHTSSIEEIHAEKT
ncbi:MAG: peroxisome assembly protein (Peroxin-2) [Stictis urceolatum]|nr:peroxisome assembly protein (Peroxin-2) [Stictis urceolata]